MARITMVTSGVSLVGSTDSCLGQAPEMCNKNEGGPARANPEEVRRRPEKARANTPASTENGDVYWNDQAVTREVLESQLAVEAQKTPQPAVNIRGDKTTRYHSINDVVSLAQAKGMRKVGFVATKEQNR